MELLPGFIDEMPSILRVLEEHVDYVLIDAPAQMVSDHHVAFFQKFFLVLDCALLGTFTLVVDEEGYLLTESSVEHLEPHPN